jgi:hypothetical protein
VLLTEITFRGTTVLFPKVTEVPISVLFTDITVRGTTVLFGVTIVTTTVLFKTVK